MEFIDYDMDEEECDELIKEAGPCEECGETETLELAVITSEEYFGTMIIFCTACNGVEESKNILENTEKLIYA